MPPELAPANSASNDALSDRAEPSDALDHPDNLNFEEPGEANQEAETTGTEPNSETDAASTEDGTQEAEENADDEQQAETEETEREEPEASAVKDDVVIDVNGEKLPLSELKSGYMKSADYTRKTQEIGNKRRELETLTARVTQSVNAIADLMVKQLPPMPDHTLAYTNPGQYVQEKAAYEAAMTQVTAVLNQTNEPKNVLNQLTQEQRQELLDSENAKLAEAFPQTAKPETRKKFFDNVANVAKDLGYSQEELNKVTDHRVFKLAHYARLGMEAEKAKTKAAAKVVNVPPMAPNKRPQEGKARKNQEAMRRLAQTGSIHDAMAIDFD